MDFTYQDFMQRQVTWLSAILKKVWFKDLLGAIFLLALVVIFFSGLLLPLHVVMFRGELPQYYVMETAIRDSLQRGSWPAWNYIYSEPLVGAPEAEVFYPLAVLTRWIPLPDKYIWDFGIHMWLAGLGIYFLSREFNARRVGALYAAISYMLCGDMQFRILSGHATLYHTLMPIPWIVLFYHKLLTQRSVTAGIITIAVTTLELLIGHPQMVLIGLLVPALYGTFMIAAAIYKKSWGDVTYRAGSSIVVAIISLLLAAALLLPLFEYLSLTRRIDGIAAERALSADSPATVLSNIVLPFAAYNLRETALGYQEAASFMGLLSVGMFVSLPFTKSFKKLPILLFLFGLALISVLLAMGGSTPIYSFVYSLFPYMRVPSRFLTWWSFGVSMISGLMLTDWLRSHKGNSVAIGALAVLMLPIIAAGAIVLSTGVVFSSEDRSFFNLVDTILTNVPSLGPTLIIILLWILVLVARRWLALKDQKLGMVIVAVLAVEVFVFAWQATHWEKYSYPTSYYLYTDPNNPIARMHPEVSQHRLTSDAGSPGGAYGFSVFSYNRSTNLSVMTNLMKVNNGPNLASASTFLALRKQPPTRADWTVIKQVDNIYLIEVQGNMPRLYAVPAVSLVKDEIEAAAALNDESFQPVQRAVVIDPTGTFPVDQLNSLSDGAQPSYQAAYVDFEPNHLKIQITSDQPVLLVITETFYPHWTATVDGKAVNIWQTNLGLRGVLVDSGTHTIEMIYDSWVARLGLVISSSTFLAVIIFSIVMIYRSRRILHT